MGAREPCDHQKSASKDLNVATCRICLISKFYQIQIRLVSCLRSLIGRIVYFFSDRLPLQIADPDRLSTRCPRRPRLKMVPAVTQFVNAPQRSRTLGVSCGVIPRRKTQDARRMTQDARSGGRSSLKKVPHHRFDWIRSPLGLAFKVRSVPFSVRVDPLQPSLV